GGGSHAYPTRAGSATPAREVYGAWEMFKATSGPPADTATESARLAPEVFCVTLNVTCAGRTGPDVGALRVIPPDPVAVQFEQRPGGIPATGVMFAVYGPLAAAGTLIGFCP